MEAKVQVKMRVITPESASSFLQSLKENRQERTTGMKVKRPQNK